MSGEELRVLADEQAALRRVATLVAGGAAPEEVFAGAVEEVGRLLRVDLVSMARYGPDRTITFLTSWGTPGHFVPIGRPLMLGGKNLNTIVFETGRPARIDSYAEVSGAIGAVLREGGVRSAAGTPIIVEGRLWGMIAAGSSGAEPLPADTEARLTQFTELLATAIANADSRAALARLADEQAALRRVATLVARGTRPEEVFAAVTNEVARLLSVDPANMFRYDSDGTLTVVASAGELFPVGSRWPLGGQRNLGTLVSETGRSARIDHYADAAGPLADDMRAEGVRSAVGTPIIVEGRLWGLMAAGSSREPLPPDTEARLASFTELVATAISNTEARSQLAASRARIVAATDQVRRRVVRDLHDGAQQRLVHTIITLGLASDALQSDDMDGARALVREALEQAEQANAELRELAHGIIPTVLGRGGLRAGVDALASRMPVPVEIDVAVGRLPVAVEATAYFVVAEALTNVAQHARAGHAEVMARIEDGRLAVQVRDDGIGGAAVGRGWGLVGLGDRVEALGGTLQLTSPAGRGTTLLVGIPLDAQTSAASPEP